MTAKINGRSCDAIMADLVAYLSKHEDKAINNIVNQRVEVEKPTEKHRTCMQKTKVILNICDVEIAAEVSFYYTPSVTGVYNLAPENCYPDEPEEFELYSLKTERGDDCDWMIPYIADDLVYQIKQEREIYANSKRSA